jgi:hypothetical protein
MYMSAHFSPNLWPEDGLQRPKHVVAKLIKFASRKNQLCFDGPYFLQCNMWHPLCRQHTFASDFFSANTKAGFQVLEFTISAGTFFKSKTLWKLRFEIELHVLWRLQLPVTAVNFCLFYDSRERSSTTSKVATQPAYPEDVRSPTKP